MSRMFRQVIGVTPGEYRRTYIQARQPLDYLRSDRYGIPGRERYAYGLD